MIQVKYNEPISPGLSKWNEHAMYENELSLLLESQFFCANIN